MAFKSLDYYSCEIFCPACLGFRVFWIKGFLLFGVPGLKYNKTIYCALNSLCLNLNNSMRHSNITAFQKPDYHPGFYIYNFYLNATKITKISCLFSVLNEGVMVA
jgi:hypothetical protein